MLMLRPWMGTKSQTYDLQEQQWQHVLSMTMIHIIKGEKEGQGKCTTVHHIYTKQLCMDHVCACFQKVHLYYYHHSGP